jgi:dinuclear metal center YbgI/SA1388 family protein
MVRIKNVFQWIDSWAPFRYAESWDNSGLQVGSFSSLVSRILVALDPVSSVIEEAHDLGCQCVVTHHPLLFRPVTVIHTDSWPGSVISRALISGITIIAAHTNLDVSLDGTNARLKELLGLEAAKPLEDQALYSDEEQYFGMGIVGTLPHAATLESLASRLNTCLGGTVRITGHPEKSVKRVAVCSGSGGSLMGSVLAADADVFISGDLKYHEARLAEESGLALIDIGHFASEKLILEPIADFLRSKAKSEKTELEIFVAKSEVDPFKLVA